MDLGAGIGHLTYSTLVHPGDTWAEMWESLTTYVPQVKRRVSPDAPFGVSLRLSNASAATLAADAGERERLKGFLDDNDLYLYTVNAFPYGPFKNVRVKEQVYEPDWRSEERTQYTINVAEVLAEVGTPDLDPSIQTAPLGFKPNVSGPDVVASYAEHVLRVAARLVDIERRTGRVVTLAIEPEPYCFLETTDETVAFFAEHLYSGAGARRLAQLADLPVSEAILALRRHVGVVFDICHQALEYEDIPESLGKLVDAGVPILKLQEAAAVYIPQVTDEIVEVLRRYADTIYLTQTMQMKDGELTRFLNLEDAFQAWESDPGEREWRVHFHIPVFLDDLGAFRSTRFAVEDALRVHKQQQLSPQLEIETYTWDVLPDELKTGDIVDYVCRELEWVRGELVGPGAGA
ncbi:MAG TPA: metabolite traffic protein EboE [Solirubrobacteraceae bacterium]|nr:metabolite traffic protein EboE [Solirubrobacteraceae bacterium]